MNGTAGASDAFVPNPERSLIPERVPIESSLSSVTPSLFSLLNEEQRRAHDIIINHLDATLKDNKPPQLLMKIMGPGGTGKTVLINAVSESFRARGVEAKLAKTATSGVAATLIGGMTLHSWAGLPVQHSNWSKKNNKHMTHLRGVEYLIIDEMSMMSLTQLQTLSDILIYVHTQLEEGSALNAFGGLNIVLTGDLHQFPPVRNRYPLYCMPDSSRDDGNAVQGRLLYELFQTVVVLKQQMRVQDQRWMELLDRLRIGECSPRDLDLLESIRMDKSTQDFESGDWDDAILVTPRHSVRNAWNRAAVQKHCAKSGQILFEVPACDIRQQDSQVPSISDRVCIAKMKSDHTGKLEHVVDLAVGMKAMVMHNISTQSDLANGTRGKILDIIFDEREPDVTARPGEVYRLHFPPACVVLELDRLTSVTFPGLWEGLVPVFPSQKTFTVTTGDGEVKVVRRQLALTPAYAFTDYKSQGQTIHRVIVDLEQPPTGVSEKSKLPHQA